jgi:hypothetical protein
MNAGLTKLCALLWLLSILVVSPNRLLGQSCGGCEPCVPCDPCQPSCAPATCSVLVPQLVTEYQPRWITCYRPETRERMVTVYRDVPTSKTIQEKYTVMVPETRTRIVTDTINHPVDGDIQLRTTTMTPEVDVRQGSQTVTRLVAVQEERVARANCCPSPAPPAESASPAPPATPDSEAPPSTSDATSTSDAASAPEAPVSVGAACNTCYDPCPPCRVCSTYWKPVSQQVRVQYPVTRFKPSSRLDTISFVEFQPETKQRQESHVVQVPEERIRTRQITVMRTVAEQRPEQYTVMVPYEKRIQVPVLTRRYFEQPLIVR